MCKQAVPTLALAFAMLGLACTPSSPPVSKSKDVADASPQAEIQPKEADNALRVALRKSLPDYFIYRGRPRGFEYDLALRFAKHRDRRLSIQIVDSDEQLETLVRRGEVDLWIPAEPWGGGPNWIQGPAYSHTDSVVVGRRGESPSQVHVRSGSVAIEDLTRWCVPPCTQAVVEASNDWELLQRLTQKSRASGQAVAVNRRHGEAFALVDPRFVIVHGMGTARPVSWWSHRSKPQLQLALKTFFESHFKLRLRAALHARYFAAPTQMRMRSRPWVRTDLAKRITRWDNDLKSAGSIYGVDWRLLAAVMMVESAQDPYATSQVGAQGLFQFMPATAKMIGLEDPSDPKQSSLAAARYLKRLMRRFRNASSPYDQRMLALSSYNVGHGHVDDARVLAGRLGLDRELWDQGVSLTLPLLAQREFYREARHGVCQGLVATRYAEHVSDLYEQYSQLLPQSLVDRDGGPERP